MATSSMVPYSNPAGNNQTTPTSTVASVPASMLPASNPLQPTTAAASNPLIPASSVIPPSIAAPTPITGDTTQATNIAPIVPGGTASNNLQTQLVDIYGQGVGASLFNEINNMSGTNSTVLQEYIASLQPQEATAQANLNASLGAGGVSANSSVAALGDANLQAQETGQIAQESANLTMDQQQLTSQLLQGTEGAAIKEVASSGWDVLGSVLGDVGSIAGDVMGLGGITGMFGGSGGGSSIPMGTQSDPGIANYLSNNGPEPASGFSPGFLEGLGG